jgi:hypothetical protein
VDSDQYDLRELFARRPDYTTASRLHLVFYGEPQWDQDSPGWGTTDLGLVLPQRPQPTLLDQIVVVAEEAELGLSSLSMGELRELLSSIPLAPALVWTARRLLWLFETDDGNDDQLGLTAKIFGEAQVVGRFESFLLGAERGERRVAFSEQQFHVLLRLCFESCAENEADVGWSDEREQRMRRALLGVTSLTGEAAVRMREERESLEDWLGFFLQNGAYNSKEQPLLAYQRAFHIFVDLAASEEARRHSSFVDLEALSRRHFSASLLELLAVGFAAFASASGDGAKPDPANLGLAREFSSYLAETAMADRHQSFSAALAAARSFYVAGFARSAADPVRLAWDMTPILQKPFFELPGGGPLLLLSPRAATSWLTEGAYYRLLDAAAAEGERDAFTTFVGWLYERYLLGVFEAALPQRPSGGGAVHGEQAYGGNLTSDIAIDFGEDLVLCEIVSTRLPLGVRAEADEAEVERFLERAVLEKLGQLHRVVDDLCSGAAQIPGVEVSAVERIWPILINVGEITEGEVLFSFIKRRAPGVLDQAHCQPLTLLGTDDAETLAGMAAAGESIIEILSEKVSAGYGELGLDRWLTDTREDPPPRLRKLEERWNHSVEQMAQVLSLPPPTS